MAASDERGTAVGRCTVYHTGILAAFAARISVRTRLAHVVEAPPAAGDGVLLKASPEKNVFFSFILCRTSQFYPISGLVQKVRINFTQKV